MPKVDLEPDDLFMLIFTSGTSGNPKAVRCTHAKITTPGTAVVGHLQLTPRRPGLPVHAPVPLGFA